MNRPGFGDVSPALPLAIGRHAERTCLHNANTYVAVSARVVAEERGPEPAAATGQLSSTRGCGIVGGRADLRYS